MATWLLTWLVPILSSPIAPLASAEPQHSKSTSESPKPRPAEISKIIEDRCISILCCKEVPLRQILDDLQCLDSIPIVMDRPALKDAGIDLDILVTIHLENTSLKTVLNHICRQAKLAWVLRDDAIVVTTPEVARGRLVTVRYPIEDLLIDQKVLTRKQQVRYRLKWADMISHTITNSIAPDSWTDHGGKGSLTFSRSERAFVIIQYHDVHEQIEAVLASLRRTATAEAKPRDR